LNKVFHLFIFFL